MPNLRHRFRVLDDLDVPDVMPLVARIGPKPSASESRSTARRIGAVIVAVVAIAGILIAYRAFRADTQRPAVTPTPTPPDGTVLPELRRDGEIIVSSGRNLVAVDPYTGRTRTLVDSQEIQGRIGNAAWSPDGTWLAYDIPGCGSYGGLWVLSAQGEPRQLRTWDCPGFGEPWAWSPDGAQLAVMHISTEGHPLILLDPSTGRETDLGATMGDVTTSPVWSPDGTWIAYGVRGGFIYSVDVEGGDQSLLVRLEGNLDSIDGIEWSPDGAHVAILADVVGALRRLYVMNADGSGLRVLNDNFEPGGWPAWFSDPSSVTDWSPDGTRLAYADFSGPDLQKLRIWTVSVDNAARSLVVSYTNPVCCIAGGTAAWSPDGSQITFDVPLDPDETRVGYLVVNADGTGDLRTIDELTYLSWRGAWYFCFCYG